MAASRENLKRENTNQGESFLKHFVEVLLGSNWLAYFYILADVLLVCTVLLCIYSFQSVCFI